jgi:hypothetical protein
MNRVYKTNSKRNVYKNCCLSLGTFSKSNRGSFFQQEPVLGNQYDDDAFMRDQLALELPREV